MRWSGVTFTMCAAGSRNPRRVSVGGGANADLGLAAGAPAGVAAVGAQGLAGGLGEPRFGAAAGELAFGHLHTERVFRRAFDLGRLTLGGYPASLAAIVRSDATILHLNH